MLAVVLAAFRRVQRAARRSRAQPSGCRAKVAGGRAATRCAGAGNQQQDQQRNDSSRPSRADVAAPRGCARLDGHAQVVARDEGGPARTRRARCKAAVLTACGSCSRRFFASSSVCAASASQLQAPSRLAFAAATCTPGTGGLVDAVDDRSYLERLVYRASSHLFRTLQLVIPKEKSVP